MSSASCPVGREDSRDVMKGMGGEGVKVSELEKGGVSGIHCSPRTPRIPRHGEGGVFSGPLPFPEAVTQNPQEPDSQASLWQRSVYLLDAEPSFREQGLTFPAPSNSPTAPGSKRTLSLDSAVGRTLAPLIGKGWKWICFFYLQPMTIV